MFDYHSYDFRAIEDGIIFDGTFSQKVPRPQGAKPLKHKPL